MKDFIKIFQSCTQVVNDLERVEWIPKEANAFLLQKLGMLQEFKVGKDRDAE